MRRETLVNSMKSEAGQEFVDIQEIRSNQADRVDVKWDDLVVCLGFIMLFTLIKAVSSGIKGMTMVMSPVFAIEENQKVLQLGVVVNEHERVREGLVINEFGLEFFDELVEFPQRRRRLFSDLTSFDGDHRGVESI